MDIVLKEDDVKRMLGEALGVDINPQDMVVSKEPFTVTISNAERYLGKKKKPALRGKPETSSPEEEPEEESGGSEPLPSDDDTPLLSMDEIKRASEGLADAPPERGSDAKRAMGGGRQLRPNESDRTPPPTQRGKEQL